MRLNFHPKLSLALLELGLDEAELLNEGIAFNAKP